MSGLLLVAALGALAAGEGGGPPPTAPADAVPLSTAIAWADAANESPAQAQARIDRALAVRRQARSLLLPTLSASASYETVSDRDDAWGARSDETLRGTVSASWSLFNGQALPGYRQAERLLDAARWNAVETRRILAFSVATAYLDVLAAERSLAAAERRRATAAQALGDARARLQAGLAARGDVARAEVEDASADLTVTTSKRSVATTRLILADLVARRIAGSLADPIDSEGLVAGQVALVLDPQARPQPADAVAQRIPVERIGEPAVQEQLVRWTVGSRPDLRARIEDLAAAHQAVRQAQGQYLPGLTANASYTDQDANAPGRPETTPEWRASLTASWTLFDAGRRGGEVDAARADLRAAQLTLAAENREVAKDVALAAENLASARAAVRQAEVRVRAARINAEDVAARGKQGLATALEVADASVTAFEADSELVRRRLELVQSWLDLRRTVGLWPLTDALP